jgi:transposase
MKVHVLGIDLAKMSSPLHGVDRTGRATLARRVRREQLLKLLSELEPSLIGIEAYTGAFYRQRQFEKLGHAVKIMAPQCVMAPDCPDRRNRYRSHHDGSDSRDSHDDLGACSAILPCPLLEHRPGASARISCDRAYRAIS